MGNLWETHGKPMASQKLDCGNQASCSFRSGPSPPESISVLFWGWYLILFWVGGWARGHGLCQVPSGSGASAAWLAATTARAPSCLGVWAMTGRGLWT